MTIAFGVKADPSVPDPIMGGTDDVDAAPDAAEVEVPAIARVRPLEEFTVLGEQTNAGVGDGVAVGIDDPPPDDSGVTLGSFDGDAIAGQSRGDDGHGTDGHHR